MTVAVDDSHDANNKTDDDGDNDDDDDNDDDRSPLEGAAHHRKMFVQQIGHFYERRDGKVEL